MKIENKYFNHAICGVAFDMDGLIFDSEKVYKEACFLAAKDFSIEITAKFYDTLIGTPVQRGRQLFFQEFGQDFVIDDFQSHWNDTRYDIIKTKGRTFKPGFEDLIQYIKAQGLPLGLVTASFKSDVQLNFGDSELLTLFDFMITHDDPYPSKPAPDKYLAAAKKMLIKPQNMLVCEDSNTGMQAAINADSIAVMVPDLLPPNEEVAMKASMIVPSLQVLHERLLES